MSERDVAVYVKLFDSIFPSALHTCDDVHSAIEYTHMAILTRGAHLDKLFGKDYETHSVTD